MEEEEYMEWVFMKWYCIYFFKFEESECNIEWCFLEEYYILINIKGVRKIFYWEKIFIYYYDYFYYLLLLNCLNIVYLVLSKNWELLDYLIDFVFCYDKGWEL